MEYYERLRQAREDKDETQAQIAELLQTKAISARWNWVKNRSAWSS